MGREVKMPAKRNNIVPNGHFHGDWQRYVKTWFNQPARKIRRRQNRVEKAARVAPRPLGKLRPVVSCPTYKHGLKQRTGRGFSLEKLKAAGFSKKYAMTVGIAVDHRRRNKSVESLQLNTQCLKEYKSKLILFPLNSKKPRKGDATAEELSKAVQLAGPLLPVKAVVKRVRAIEVTDDLKKFGAFQTIRQARAFQRLHGIRAKKAADAEADELSKKK